MLKVREIVLKNKLPRRLVLQPNLFKKENKIIYKDYDVNFEGVIQSYVDRFEGELMEDVLEEFTKYEDHFKYKL